jgi:cell division protein ZapA
MTKETPASSSISLTIELLNRKYHLSCASDSKHALEEAATFLNEKMMALDGKVKGMEKISVFSALSLSDEVLSEKNSRKLFTNSLNERINNLSEKIDQALEETQFSPSQVI